MAHSLRRAENPECISAETERACSRPATVLGPQPGLWNTLGKVLDDSQRIPDRDIAIDQRRHLAGLRNAQYALLVLVTGIKRDEDFLEREFVGAQSQPRPHRP